MAELGFHTGLIPCPDILKLPLSESMLDCVFNLAQETLITYLIFLPKLHNLTLIMREYQTKPNLRDVLKNNWPKFFKNVNVMKIKERPESHSRCMNLDWILDQTKTFLFKNYGNN